MELIPIVQKMSDFFVHVKFPLSPKVHISLIRAGTNLDNELMCTLVA